MILGTGFSNHGRIEMLFIDGIGAKITKEVCWTPPGSSSRDVHPRVPGLEEATPHTPPSENRHTNGGGPRHLAVIPPVCPQ